MKLFIGIFMRDAISRFFLAAVSGFLVFCGSIATQAQSTIANYDFNAGSSYATLTPTLLPGVTATASSTQAFATFGGTATAAGAFITNATAGNAIAMNDSSGTNTKYFQFDIAGVAPYSQYKVYFQAQRSGTGATTATLAYSPTGCAGPFTNFGTPQTVGTTFATTTPTVFDLSAIGALNNQANVCFRILASGASGTGTLRIDNFQVQGVLPPSGASVNVGGRATDEFGNGISRIRIVMTNSSGATRYALTNLLGYYVFHDVEVGETYIFEASSKRYQFANPLQVVSVEDEVRNVNFSAFSGFVKR